MINTYFGMIMFMFTFLYEVLSVISCFLGQAPGTYFNMEFRSTHAMGHKGFYATYQIYEHPPDALKRVAVFGTPTPPSPTTTTTTTTTTTVAQPGGNLDSMNEEDAGNTELMKDSPQEEEISKLEVTETERDETMAVRRKRQSEPCPPPEVLDCRDYCYHGHLKNDFGCDTCICLQGDTGER